MATQPHISFEFFAAKTEQGRQKLQTHLRKSSIAITQNFSRLPMARADLPAIPLSSWYLDLQQQRYQAAPHLSFGGDCKDTGI